MPAELLSSKLFVPALRPSLVPRPRLIQSLNEGLSTKRKLTLISAPAGSGKTTLVVNWLKQIDLPVAWLSLDQEDNDLPRFLAYLAGAFQQVDEELGASLRSALQSPQLPAVERVLTGLINEIAARTDPLILVLDDYHLLTDRAILEAMRFFLDHQPHQLHLVLTTREDPDLPLARLRGRDQLSEIRARDLRFTQEEAGIFLRSVMGLPLSDQDIAALEGRTEGWAVGLQLAGLSMQKQADLRSFIADFSGSHRHILDYLTDEVLQQQPEDIRNFLLQTALLDRLSSPLCDALTARNDSNKVLAHLEAANLFLIPLDERRVPLDMIRTQYRVGDFGAGHEAAPLVVGEDAVGGGELVLDGREQVLELGHLVLGEAVRVEAARHLVIGALRLLGGRGDVHPERVEVGAGQDLERRLAERLGAVGGERPLPARRRLPVDVVPLGGLVVEGHGPDEREEPDERQRLLQVLLARVEEGARRRAPVERLRHAGHESFHAWSRAPGFCPYTGYHGDEIQKEHPQGLLPRSQIEKTSASLTDSSIQPVTIEIFRPSPGTRIELTFDPWCICLAFVDHGMFLYICRGTQGLPFDSL